MDVETLREFLTLAEQRNFTRTARYLNVSQPSLTRRIATLERELGVALFDRETSPISLTHAGQILLGDLEGVVVAHDKALRRARSLSGHGMEKVLVGGMMGSRPTADPFRMAVSKLAVSHPYVQVEMVEDVDRPFLDELLDGNIDLTFIVAGEMLLRHMSAMGLSCRFLHCYPFMLLVPPASPLYSRESDTVLPNDLTGERLVLFRNRLWPQTCSWFHEVVEGVEGIDVYERNVRDLAGFSFDGIEDAVLVLIAGVLEQLPSWRLRNMRLMHIDGVENSVETYLVWRSGAKNGLVNLVADAILDARASIPSDFLRQAEAFWTGLQQG